MTERIRAGIARSEWVVGQRLPSERALAARFGAGRGMVREALKGLEAEGVLEPRPRVGVFVRAAGPVVGPSAFGIRATAVDLLAARELLEPRAAYLAALYATEEWLDRIARSLEVFADRDRALMAAGEFHVLCAQAGGNALLAQLIGHFAQLTRADYLAYASQDLHKLAMAQHDEIFDHIVHRDADAAQSATVLHVRAVAALYGLPARTRRPLAVRTTT